MYNSTITLQGSGVDNIVLTNDSKNLARIKNITNRKMKKLKKLANLLDSNDVVMIHAIRKNNSLIYQNCYDFSTL